jgi:hypothetical protein
LVPDSAGGAGVGASCIRGGTAASLLEKARYPDASPGIPLLLPLGRRPAQARLQSSTLRAGVNASIDVVFDPNQSGNRGLSLFSRDVKKCADGFEGRWETAPGEVAMEPSKTIGFIAIVLLVILVTSYALGEDGTAPTAAQIAEQQR